MANLEALNERDETEETYLVERKPSWTRMDKLLAVFGALISFGHGVETYLPGVITQQISCATELSEWQEGTLDCILYITLAIALVISGPLSDWFGRRELMLFSLYLSGLSTVVCAIVANYYSLLLSRALIGIGIGLSCSTNEVMIGELASKKAILNDILMISTIMYAIGGVWSAGLGYLLLDLIDWRIFILLTSIPIFLPPIFMLHLSYAATLEQPDKQNQDIPKGTIMDEQNQDIPKGTTNEQNQDIPKGTMNEQNQDIPKGTMNYEQNQDIPKGTMNEQNQDIPKGTMNVPPNFIARTIKIGLFDGTNLFQGWITILLVPTLIQMLKIEKAEPNSDCSVTTAQGADLLLLGIVTSAALFGTLFRHFIGDMLSFRKLQVTVALLNMVAFTAMLITKENIVVFVVCNFVVKFLFGITAMNAAYIFGDIDYFGTEKFALGSGISSAIGFAGGMLGTAMVAFTPMTYAITTAIVISALNVFLVLSMTEVK